jgi:hypothetical protein
LIAALYVQTNGCYFGLPDVDPWDEARDARLYAGPWPVVAHPPCERWGRYWFGGPSARVRRIKGDDGGCFAAALAAVRLWGGVLEHPEASAAWARFGIAAPPKAGGWLGLICGGWTCCVEQGHYGHRARKATWLYAHGVELPSLKWGRSAWTAKLDQGFHSKEERARFKAGLRQETGVDPAERTRSRDEYERITGQKHFARLGTRECAATPPAFRDLLIGIARSAMVHEGSTTEATAC